MWTGKKLTAVFILASLSCTYSKTPEQPIILISIDGCRWDMPDKAETPNLDFLIETGVRAKSLIPCFPTKTFPNHYSIVTGLYPGNHGVVANNMYDPERRKRFALSLRDAVQDPAWWGGEPIWVTAAKAGLVTASYFWVGTEAKIKGVQPTYWFMYDGTVPNEERVAQVLQWLDLPAARRPVFITVYFSTLDDAGHAYHPDSREVKRTMQSIDSVLGILLEGLAERKLLDKVNILVVSDHGMAATSSQRVIFLDDYIDLQDVQMVDWDPVAAMNPKPGKERRIYEQLRKAHPNLQVYKKEDTPARFHYNTHPRIPRLIVIAGEGWSISTRDRFREQPERFEGGTHGYDNRLESMGALFVAHGPAFKSGLTVGSFQNIHLYELMAKILNLEPAPNDGSLDSVRVMLNP
ncbi:MAG: ectonucleotide pyrophosphatase/phosphodiesterase [bacterium]